MTSLIEPLVALATGVALVVASLLKPRSNTDPREQIKKDIELRKMLNEHAVDDLARAALTISIRKSTQELTYDEPDWFDRWGLMWVLPGSLLLLFSGMNMRELADDFETSPGTYLALELTGGTLMMIAGLLIGIWFARAVSIPLITWFSRRKQRKAMSGSAGTDQAQRSASETTVADPANEPPNGSMAHRT